MDRGEDFSFFILVSSKYELPTVLLQTWVAAVRGSRKPSAHEPQPRRSVSRAQPPRTILRTHIKCRNQTTALMRGEQSGFLHPATAFAATAKDYPWISLRTSSWKPLRFEGNFRRPCPEISLPRHRLSPSRLVFKTGLM